MATEKQTSYKNIITELFSYVRAGIKPGLDSINFLLEVLGRPEKEYMTIHVAGTNGKGSVSNMLASILQEAGLKVGLFTSPHIRKFNERIRVNGQCITDEELVFSLRGFLDSARRNEATFFDITTALAFEYFKNKKVDIAVIETGMGGSWDSTNCISPILSIITQIDMDHTEYLGKTLMHIAEEKAGIIKDNTPVIISDNHVELKNLFIKQAREKNAPIIFSDQWFDAKDTLIDANLNMECTIFDEFISYPELKLPLAGIHQIMNLKTVIAAYNHLKFVLPLNETHLRNGLEKLKENTEFGYRTEVIPGKHKIVVDVSHNPAGANSLVETIQLSPLKDVKFDVYFAAMQDKDLEMILAIIKPIARSITFVSLDIDRAASIDYLESLAQLIGYGNIKKTSVAEDAFRAINSDALICGSFHTVEAFLNSGFKNQ